MGWSELASPFELKGVPMTGPNSTVRTELRITAAVLRDFEARQVFFELRPLKALARFSDGAAAFGIGHAAAAALLADAAARLPTCKGPLASAYSTHQGRCWTAIEELQAVELALHSERAVLLDDDPEEHLETWAGTRASLTALFPDLPRGPWPGEPGRPGHHLEARDGTGQHVLSLGRLDKLAPGTFKLLRWPIEAAASAMRATSEAK